MNVKLCDNSWRIGKARFVAEVSPMMKLMKDDNSNTSLWNIMPDFIQRHKKDMDTCLINNGYLITVGSESDPSDHSRHYNIEINDGNAEIAPDYDLLNGEIIDTLEGVNKDNGSRAYIITQMLYRDLYDEDDMDIILVHKARYLCDILANIFSIEYYDRGWDTDISIVGIKEDAGSVKLRQIEDMIFDLGFLPCTITELKHHQFIINLEEYLNRDRYFQDGFSFGEAILGAYDRHIQRIDWYDHEYYLSLFPPVADLNNTATIPVRGLVI